jgi:hypothetical protein
MNAVPESVTTLFPTVDPCHFWLVGGAVRDQLLGLDRDDCDVVAMVRPEELIAAGFRILRKEGVLTRMLCKRTESKQKCNKDRWSLSIFIDFIQPNRQ